MERMNKPTNLYLPPIDSESSEFAPTPEPEPRERVQCPDCVGTGCRVSGMRDGRSVCLTPCLTCMGIGSSPVEDEPEPEPEPATMSGVEQALRSLADVRVKLDGFGGAEFKTRIPPPFYHAGEPALSMGAMMAASSSAAITSAARRASIQHEQDANALLRLKMIDPDAFDIDRIRQLCKLSVTTGTPLSVLYHAVEHFDGERAARDWQITLDAAVKRNAVTYLTLLILLFLAGFFIGAALL